MSYPMRPSLRMAQRRGITSLDLLFSIPSTAILLAGLGSCIALMLRSYSQDERFYRNVQQIADASLQMAMEIEMANGIAETTPTSIEFCVPDRNGDSLPEQIRYEWKINSTSNRKDLYRRINQEAESSVISDITGFELQYSYARASSIPNRFRSESVLLKKVDSIPSAQFLELPLDSARQVCITFFPDSRLGSFNTWDLGSLELMLRSANPNAVGTFRVQVTSVLPNQRPDTANVYADILMNNQDLSAKYQYVEFPLAPIDQVLPGVSLAVILSTSFENPPIRVQCLRVTGDLPSGLSTLQTDNGGMNWNSIPNVSPRFLASGYTSSSSSTISSRRNLATVDILITGLQGLDPTMMASAKLLAQPEVP